MKLKEKNSFGEKLRKIRTAAKMTQRELAVKLDIGQSAVANYENGSRLPDTLILKNISALFNISLDDLLSNTEKQKNIKGSEKSITDRNLSEKYIQIMGTSDFIKAQQLIMDSVQKGASLETIFDGVMVPVLHRIGSLWEKGELSIAGEHFLSAEIEQTIAVLSYPETIPVSKRITSVCTAAGPEMHNLGARMVSSLLRSKGWNSRFLGNHTPASDLAEFCSIIKADFLFLSVTMETHLDSAEIIVDSVHSVHPGCRIIAGGKAFERNPKAWTEINADGYAETVSSAHDTAINLLTG